MHKLCLTAKGIKYMSLLNIFRSHINQDLKILNFKLFVKTMNALESSRSQTTLKDLELIRKEPKLYLINYFSELQNQIDIEFELMLQDEESLKAFLPAVIIEAQCSLIAILKSFEQMCLLSLNSDQQKRAKLDQIFIRVNSMLSRGDTCQEQLDQVLAMIQELLFCNRSIMFVTSRNPSQILKDKLRIKSKPFGNLLIIQDEFVQLKVLQEM